MVIHNYSLCQIEERRQDYPAVINFLISKKYSFGIVEQTKNIF